MANALDAQFEDMNGRITTLRELGDDDTSAWVVVMWLVLADLQGNTRVCKLFPPRREL